MAERASAEGLAARHRRTPGLAARPPPGRPAGRREAPRHAACSLRRPAHVRPDGIGYAARAIGYWATAPAKACRTSSSPIAIPALIFKTLTAAQLPAAQPWGYWFSYFGGVLVVWTLATVIARKVFAVSHVEGVVAGFTAGQSNTVLVGIPLILEAFGPKARCRCSC